MVLPEFQTVESILSAHSPAIKVPELLKTQRGRVMRQSYKKDELLPHGYGFAFENELQKEVFEQLKSGVEEVRSAMFALCNRFGVLSGPLPSPLNMGMVFNRAQDETIWHVDRNDQENEYYTLLSPADSTVAKTWVSPILHFLACTCWLGSMDSNHGMGASKAPALPLGDSPIAGDKRITATQSM